MSREIGIILVHGIGSQDPGQRARQMMVCLCDEEACYKPNVHATARSRDAISDQASVGEALTYRFNVHGEPVQLREANWAPLSHPDNPPRVQLAPYIFPEFLDTVSSAWAASPLARSARRLTRRRTPTEVTLIWLAIAITGLFVALLVLWAFVLEKSDEASTLFGIVMAPFFLYPTYRRVRHRWLVLRHKTLWRRLGISVIYSWIAYMLVVLQLLLFTISTEFLLFMAIPVIVAVAVNFIFFPVAQLFVGLGRLAAACRMGGVTRWVHRLGWVMVVLPVHTLLQATKASGNLMSILFSEKQMRVKAIAACWLVGVYLGFLVVTIFAEMLIVVPFVPFLPPFQGWAELAITFVFSFGIYLLLLKVSLTPLDLLLDVENYHIASMEDRGPYHQRVDQAVRALRDSGCTEIHIVAHSLGSVIVYDWLSATPSTDLPLMALHTLGSPLNKFWYVDHARRRRLADANLLAKFPACRWTNYWAFSDVVSGPSTRYKAPGAKSRDKRIRWLGPVLASHVYYWTNAIVLTGIRNGIAKSEGSSDPATLAGTARI